MTKSAQKGQRTEKLLLNIPAGDMRAIGRLVSSGRYSTKSEVVRSALKEFLYNRERVQRMGEFSKEVEQRVKEIGLTRQDLDKAIEEVKDETRKEVRRMLRPEYLKKLKRIEREGHVKVGSLDSFKKRYGLR